MHAWKAAINAEGLNSVWAPNGKDIGVHVHDLRIAYECTFTVVTNETLMIFFKITHNVLRPALTAGFKKKILAQFMMELT